MGSEEEGGLPDFRGMPTDSGNVTIRVLKVHSFHLVMYLFSWSQCLF